MRTPLILVLLLLCINITAQNFYDSAVVGEFKNDAKKTACLHPEHRKSIVETLKANEKQLEREGKLASLDRNSNIKFVWPVRKASHVTANNVWGISNYVDHNASYPDKLRDFNCGTKTYDTNNGYNHRGIDMFAWPFAWTMMKNNDIEVVAAASGQIIYKHDGEFDKSCNSNNNNWNAVYIRHSDGTVAWYGHLKKNSLTSKSVGQTINEGEYIGVVGSSGNSTGPHLHFEVWENSSYQKNIDPFAGSCNGTNTTSKWKNQKQYKEPTINAIMSHDKPPVFSTCPNGEKPNIKNDFQPNEKVYLVSYLKDQMKNTSIQLKLIRPDGTVQNWSKRFARNRSASWARWFFRPNIEGEWTWKATYGGKTITHTFNVSERLSTEEENNIINTRVYPNPTAGNLTINSSEEVNSVAVFDIRGRKLISKIENNIKNIDISALNAGVYYVRVANKQRKYKNFKIIKK